MKEPVNTLKTKTSPTDSLYVTCDKGTFVCSEIPNKRLGSIYSIKRQKSPLLSSIHMLLPHNENQYLTLLWKQKQINVELKSCKELDWSPETEMKRKRHHWTQQVLWLFLNVNFPFSWIHHVNAWYRISQKTFPQGGEIFYFT